MRYWVKRNPIVWNTLFSVIKGCYCRSISCAYVLGSITDEFCFHSTSDLISVKVNLLLGKKIPVIESQKWQRNNIIVLIMEVYNWKKIPVIESQKWLIEDVITEILCCHSWWGSITVVFCSHSKPKLIWNKW